MMVGVKAIITQSKIKIMIIVKNKRCSEEKLKKEYPGCIIIDVTSKGDGEWQKLSPFYPHGSIPVPFSSGIMSMSVEGIWQGLKVFENEDIDYSSFRNDTMKGIKRTCRTHGRCRGHRKGVNGDGLLEYIEARKQIYVPSYFWMLKNKCAEQVKKIRIMSHSRPVVLLDYDTNGNIEDFSKPLSHASLIKEFIEKGCEYNELDIRDL